MLTNALGAIFSTMVLAAAAWGMGGWIWPRLSSGFSRFDRFSCAWLGGLGLLGTLLFLIGQFAFTRSTIFLTLGAAVGAAAGLLTRKGKTAIALSMRNVKIPPLPALIIATVLLVTALGGLSEIVGDWGNDAVVYHLLGPKVWLRNGIVRPVPDDCQTAFPVTAEILYGAQMALGGKCAPGFSAVLTLTMFFLVIGSLAVRSGLDYRGAWWAVALVAAMPAVYTGGHSGFVDVLYASFVLAAARIGFDAQSTRDYIVFGLFCGLAMATKYTGLLALVPLVFCSALQLVISKRGSSGLAMKQAGIAIAVAAAVAAPVYIRNWILLGCPIYPPPLALFRFFPVKYVTKEVISGFQANVLHHAQSNGFLQGSSLGRMTGAYLLLPFNLTYHTSNFNGAGGIGLAPLALGPLGLIAARREGFIRALALLAFLLTTLWFLSDQESRYLIHVYAISAILAVLGWRCAVSAASRVSPLLASATIACSLLYGLSMIGSSRLDDIHAVFSNSFAQQRKQERIPFLASFEYLNKDASVKEVLILDPSVPPYYCDKPYLKPIGTWGERTLANAPDLTHVLGELRHLHVSHVLDVNSGYFPFQLPEHTPDLTLVFERPNQRIYRVARQQVGRLQDGSLHLVAIPTAVNTYGQFPSIPREHIRGARPPVITFAD
jgi:hypothetical protein